MYIPTYIIEIVFIFDNIPTRFLYELLSIAIHKLNIIYNLLLFASEWNFY